jgi:hypothetical protein
MTERVYRVHCFGRTFVTHGEAEDVKRLVDRLNHNRPRNVWSAQLVPGLAGHHGVSAIDELARLEQRKN